MKLPFQTWWPATLGRVTRYPPWLLSDFVYRDDTVFVWSLHATIRFLCVSEVKMVLQRCDESRIGRERFGRGSEQTISGKSHDRPDPA